MKCIGSTPGSEPRWLDRSDGSADGSAGGTDLRLRDRSDAFWCRRAFSSSWQWPSGMGFQERARAAKGFHLAECVDGRVWTVRSVGMGTMHGDSGMFEHCERDTLESCMGATCSNIFKIYIYIYIYMFECSGKLSIAPKSNRIPWPAQHWASVSAFPLDPLLSRVESLRSSCTQVCVCVCRLSGLKGPGLGLAQFSMGGGPV